MSKEELIEEAQRMRTVDPYFKPIDDEMTDYVHKHCVLDFNFDEYGILTLFHPIDKEKYVKDINKNRYKQNHFSKSEHGLYTMYIIFIPASLKEIEKLVYKIINKNIYPFKIVVDLGFIVEDTKKYEIL